MFNPCHDGWIARLLCQCNFFCSRRNTQLLDWDGSRWLHVRVFAISKRLRDLQIGRHRLVGLTLGLIDRPVRVVGDLERFLAVADFLLSDLERSPGMVARCRSAAASRNCSAALGGPGGGLRALPFSAAGSPAIWVPIEMPAGTPTFSVSLSNTSNS